MYSQWRGAFAEALDPRLYNIEYLDARVANGTAWFAGNDDAGIVVEIKYFPTGAMAVHGLVAAGDVEAIKALIRDAEAWGKAQGCIGGMISSRPAWAKIMKAEGYSMFQASIWKDL